MPADITKLDNPAWHALIETHACFAMGNSLFKRYDPEIVLFAGFDRSHKNITAQFDQVTGLQDSFFLFDSFPALPANYQVETVVECLQMVCEKPVPVNLTEEIIELNEKDTGDMFALVSEVFPGYYLPKTRQLGSYFGIRDNGQLVAIAGERLRMNGFTEISAVVTHPAHAGRKYAQQLVSYLNDKNMQEGNTPFLHTGSGNQRAIDIYELLGYKKRRLIPVTKIKRTA